MSLHFGLLPLQTLSFTLLCVASVTTPINSFAAAMFSYADTYLVAGYMYMSCI